MRDDKNIIEEKIHICIGPAERVRIQDDANSGLNGIKKCYVDTRSEVMIVRITLGKVLQMIANVELEVTHNLSIANACFKSKV